MSVFTEKRTEVQAELTSLSRKLQDLLAEAGTRIVRSESLPDEEPYTTLTARDAELAARLQDVRTTRERIVAIGDRMGEIGRQRDELEKRRKEIGSELEPHYQTIGENAFRVFRDNPLVDQEYADIFTPVLDAHEELKHARDELSRAEGELAEKPFLEKMVLRGRIIVMRNRLTVRESQLERLYRDAGRQIAGTDFITTIGDPGLDEAASPFLELMDESRRLDDEIAALDEERESLQGELSALGVERRAGSRIGELDSQIEQAEQQRRESLSEIATAVKGSDLVETLDDDTRAALEEISQAESQLESARDRLERLDAAIEAERLHGDMDQLDQSIARKRAQIATLTDEIEDLEQKKAGIRSRVEEAERARGPVENLLE
ncbi:MAG: hypothetical protein ACOC37_03480 [Spirochaetota bacterium]